MESAYIQAGYETEKFGKRKTLTLWNAMFGKHFFNDEELYQIYIFKKIRFSIEVNVAAKIR